MSVLSALPSRTTLAITLFLTLCICAEINAQVVINEGSNKNYLSYKDEDGKYPDWIEIYNPGSDTVHLAGYSLTDDISAPSRWVFPNVSLAPGEFKVVFCSGNDRKPVTGFKHVLTASPFKAVPGWNTHQFSTPFYWDGTTNILLNMCSYSSVGYTVNSVFNQTDKTYPATIFAVQDGSPNICFAEYGSRSNVRPNIRFNDIPIDTGIIQNTPTDYPAPYGNWYWAAKHQMLFRGSELAEAGLVAGDITNLAFDVVWTDSNTVYDYIDFDMKLVSAEALTSSFETVDTNNYLHTNFKISSSGETIFLFSPTQVLLSSLYVHSDAPDNSTGSFPDASENITLFQLPSPAATNNLSDTFSTYLTEPIFSLAPGLYDQAVEVRITNYDSLHAHVHYTTDGNDPTADSPEYTGEPISIFYSSVLKARAFADGILPSPIAVASYLLGISHTTPVLSVVTDQTNLYGANGIFDNWAFDWERNAYVEYFDSTQQLIFSQQAGMQIDGGAGGSRAHPQHSFRIELDHAVLGEGPIEYPLIPNKPDRTTYSNFYLRNGSNQYLVLPYKDACQLESMGGEINSYYSGWRPVTVYINGNYFGLYELREKMDEEFFVVHEEAEEESIDLLSQSYWNNSVLRAIEGSVEPFYDDAQAFNALDPASPEFWDLADQYFDMDWYVDYIIAESWMANTDWPGNNIRIYRSDKTNYRWRFCLLDMELGLLPNGWTDCYFDHINHMLGQDPNNPYINVWLKGMQNPRFRNYFINRFADLMNTSYKIERISAIEQSMFNQTVLEMPREYSRWGDPNNVAQQMTDFVNRHHEFQFQLSERTGQVRNHIQADLGLNGQVEVTIDAFPAGAGTIKISTVTPDALPWTGVYFDGNPVVITATPNPGYAFVYWDANSIFTSPDFNASIELNIPTDETFRAVFTTSGSLPSLAISELNYHSDSTRNAGDWIELLNFGSDQINLTGWKFTDSANEYFFPAGTMLAPGARLVLAEDILKFNAQHPGVEALGPLDFEFSNSTETLSVINNSSQTVVSMTYDDAHPWPAAADGYGRTIELKVDDSDPAVAENWFAGCIGGSPGTPYIPCIAEIIFSEINYSSADTADAGDWIEIQNNGPLAVDLSGWVFSDDDDDHLYTIPDGTIVSPSGFFVLYNNTEKFNSRFPSVNNAAGPFDFGLGSVGDALRLYDGSGLLYQSLVYGTISPWPQGAAGNGYTLQILDPTGNCCDAANWIDGCPEGSPGAPFIFPCDLTSVVHIYDGSLFKLYPNPTTGKFTISAGENGKEINGASLDVFNILGTKIYSIPAFSLQNNVEIDLTGFPAGVYSVQLRLRGNIFTEKVVIGWF
ncbi:MAG TPA: lamin tail domain-containing protein [Saprospiraceae bacterium]|nr:lamin tail domain-containing protein [Saprospiraceae bacterium]